MFLFSVGIFLWMAPFSDKKFQATLSGAFFNIFDEHPYRLL